jgi:transketolase
MGEFKRGGYLVCAGGERPEVVISASGSEVQTALQVKDILEKEHISCRVISIPDREAFACQELSYRKKILGGENTVQVAIEAATGQGWYEVIPNLAMGIFIRRFGESGPGDKVAALLGLEAKKLPVN